MLLVDSTARVVKTSRYHSGQRKKNWSSWSLNLLCSSLFQKLKLYPNFVHFSVRYESRDHTIAAKKRRVKSWFRRIQYSPCYNVSWHHWKATRGSPRSVQKSTGSIQIGRISTNLRLSTRFGPLGLEKIRLKTRAAAISKLHRNSLLTKVFIAHRRS